MTGRRLRLCIVLLWVVPSVGTGLVWAQSAQLQVESRDLYAGLPFVLSLSAEGFDEQPAPAVP